MVLEIATDGFTQILTIIPCFVVKVVKPEMTVYYRYGLPLRY
jgi:hypothetical protein